MDETADIEKAGARHRPRRSFDNNVICTDEKTVIAVASIADALKRAMAATGAYVLAEPSCPAWRT